MSWEDWQAARNPKVTGTWNLHHALLSASIDLDFFFLFSSTAAVMGQNGQANYSAGNTFQDAFVGYRHSLGLPASSIHVGIVEDVGYISRNPDLLGSLKATSQMLVQEAELLSAIELALQRSTPSSSSSPGSALGSPSATSRSPAYVNKSQFALGLKSVMPINAPSNRTPWRRDPRLLVYRNLEHKPEASAAEGTSDETILNFLREASTSTEFLKSDESAILLATEIGRTLLGFLMKPDAAEAVNIDAPLAAVGIDSLVSIELRNWLRRKVGVEFTVLEITGAQNLRALGIEAQGKLVGKTQMHT